MATMPDFIQAFHDEIFDEQASRALRALASEFNEKLDRLHRNAIFQEAHSKMHKDFGGRPSVVETNQREKELKNEYKARTIAIAKPHVEENQFGKLAKIHAPHSVYQDREEALKKEKEEKTEQFIQQRRQQQTATNEEITEKKEENIEAKQIAKETLQEEKARKTRELIEQFKQTKEQNLGINL